MNDKQLLREQNNLLMREQYREKYLIRQAKDKELFLSLPIDEQEKILEKRKLNSSAFYEANKEKILKKRKVKYAMMTQEGKDLINTKKRERRILKKI